MLRTALGSERIQRVDPRTGIKVIQLTSYPSPSLHCFYAWPSITPDNRYILFHSQRWAGRSAPWDLFRCDADGLNLFQLTELPFKAGYGAQYGAPRSVMTLDGRFVYSVVPVEDVLLKTEIETGTTEQIVRLRHHLVEDEVLGQVYMSHGGDRLFINVLTGSKADAHYLRVDVASGEVAESEHGLSVWGCYPDRRRLLILANQMILATRTGPDGTREYANEQQNPMDLISVDEDGGDACLFGAAPTDFAHATFLGKQAVIQGTGHLPDRCVWLAEEGGMRRKLCEGPYFWHSGASWDGEWILADTNWPDRGLHLVHVPTGHYRFVCHPGASQDHPQHGHPHPALSMDGRIGVFDSDRNGITQVYAVHFGDDFRRAVAEGETLETAVWQSRC